MAAELADRLARDEPRRGRHRAGLDHAGGSSIAVTDVDVAVTGSLDDREFIVTSAITGGNLRVQTWRVGRRSGVLDQSRRLLRLAVAVDRAARLPACSGARRVSGD
jgi:hypothetical protein